MKKLTKSILAFTLGIITSLIVVKATTYISGSNVEYNNSKLTSTNINDAINELYTLSKTKKTIRAWEYHETGNNKCINGEEDTCISTECYKSGSTCETGTVIKYYVNDNEYRYFYVLRDNGTVITMQQRENTIRNIAWHSGENDNSYGPDTILSALEQATSIWTNVDILNYEPGVTNLYDGPNVSCTYKESNIICDDNSYANSTLGIRKARSRMITAKEAHDTGCLVYSSSTIGSCPDFMYNNLWQSKSYGGSYENNTKNESNNYDCGYWTSSFSSGSITNSWYVYRRGGISLNSNVADDAGARAVVEITKSNL